MQWLFYGQSDGLNVSEDTKRFQYTDRHGVTWIDQSVSSLMCRFYLSTVACVWNDSLTRAEHFVQARWCLESQLQPALVRTAPTVGASAGGMPLAMSPPLLSALTRQPPIFSWICLRSEHLFGVLFSHLFRLLTQCR